VKRPGKIVLIKFPGTDMANFKFRPALVLKKVPGKYDDWLICMITSRRDQYIEGFDEILEETSNDFAMSGLKKTSVIRLARLAIVAEEIIAGSIGEISQKRLKQIKTRIAKWIRSDS